MTIMTRQTIIEPIESDAELSVKSQLESNILALKSFVNNRIKVTKGMNVDECKNLYNALDLLYDEISYWL